MKAATDDEQEPEEVIAVRQRLATSYASLRSTEAQIEAGLVTLAKQVNARIEARQRIKKLEGWLTDQGRGVQRAAD